MRPVEIRAVLARFIGAVDVAFLVLVNPFEVAVGGGLGGLGTGNGSFRTVNRRTGSAVAEKSPRPKIFCGPAEPARRFLVMKFG
jgi:hypothetical protein